MIDLSFSERPLVVTIDRSASPARTMRLKITDLARGGAGVGRDSDGRAVFVPLTAPGDEVEVRITKEKKKFAFAELVQVIEPGSQRRQARCPAFESCGGCDWQHLPYELQWETKVRGAKEAIARVGIEYSGEWDLLPAKKEWNYRNRIQLRGEGGQLGFYARGSHQLVPVDQCDLADPRINDAWGDLAQESQDKMGGRDFSVEVAIDEAGDLIAAFNHSKRGGFVFRQVNDEQNQVLRKWVSQRVPDQKRVFDLYGGGGNLSRGLAAKARSIDCVDLGVPKDVQAPENFRFHRAPVAKFLQSKRSPQNVDWVILDPPRQGLGKDAEVIVEELGRRGAQGVIAIGCDVDQWAKDLRVFSEKGWKIQELGALDLFPQTVHLECLALLGV